MTRTPRPESKFVFLFNEKLRHVTRHHYVETVECMLPFSTDYPGGPAWHHLFECDVSGIQRVWGCEERALSAFDREVSHG